MSGSIPKALQQILFNDGLKCLILSNILWETPRPEYKSWKVLKKKKSTRQIFKFRFSDCIRIISLRDVHCGFKVLKLWPLASRYSRCLPEHPHHYISYIFLSSCNTEERGIHSIFISTGGSLLAGFSACGTRAVRFHPPAMSPCGRRVHSPGSPCWWDQNVLDFSWALAAVHVRQCCRETEICWK